MSLLRSMRSKLHLHTSPGVGVSRSKSAKGIAISTVQEISLTWGSFILPLTDTATRKFSAFQSMSPEIPEEPLWWV